MANLHTNKVSVYLTIIYTVTVDRSKWQNVRVYTEREFSITQCSSTSYVTKTSRYLTRLQSRVPEDQVKYFSYQGKGGLTGICEEGYKVGYEYLFLWSWWVPFYKSTYTNLNFIPLIMSKNVKTVFNTIRTKYLINKILPNLVEELRFYSSLKTCSKSSSFVLVLFIKTVSLDLKS